MGRKRQHAVQRGDEREVKPGAVARSREVDTAQSPVLELQRAAGNSAVAALVQRETAEFAPALPDVKQESNAVTSFETVKDAWAHAKSWFHKDKKGEKKESEGEEAEGAEWEKPSEEAALHVRQVLDGASLAMQHVAKHAEEEEAREAAKELAEQLHQGSELVEKGAKGFEFLVKAEKYAEVLNKIREASNDLDGLDVQRNRSRAADDFGAMISGFGTLGKALPDGPWSAYFTLTEKVSGHWLRTVASGFAPHDEKQLRQVEGMGDIANDPGWVHPEEPAERESKESEHESEPAEAPVTLDDLGSRVHEKYDDLREKGLLSDPSGIAVFDAKLPDLLAAVEDWKKLGTLGHMVTHRAESQELSKKIIKLAREVYQSLLRIDIAGFEAEKSLLQSLIAQHHGSLVE